MLQVVVVPAEKRLQNSDVSNPGKGVSLEKTRKVVLGKKWWSCPLKYACKTASRIEVG